MNLSLPGPDVLRACAEEWLVAVTIATEVPPRPVQSPHSKQAFTAAMIPVAAAAVAQVVVNRVHDARFPDTALAVVLQPKQFSGVLRGVTLAQAGHRDFWLDAACGRWYHDHVARCLDAWRAARGRGPAAGGALWYYSPVGMLPPHRVPGWAAALAPVAVPGLAPDYFRFFGPKVGS